MMDDREILRLFEKHDERALMETTGKYEAYSRAIAYTLLGEESAAQECFREALHSIWKADLSTRPKSLKIQMGRLARAAALKYKEEEPEVTNSAEIEAIVGELEECVEPGFSEAGEGRFVETMDAFLASVPSPKRILFVQRYWYGRSIWAISENRRQSPDGVEAELSEIRDGLERAFREARVTWPVDGKTYLMERIGEIDDAYIEEADTNVTVITDSYDPNEFRGPAAIREVKTGKKLANKRKIKRIVFVAAGVSAVAALLWFAVPSQHVEIDIDENHFPDEHFRKMVSDSYDLDKNGKLSKEECEAVYEISVTGSSSYISTYSSNDEDVSNFKGIEYFSNLEKLICDQNHLTSLDVSKNKALEYLDCSGNQLTELDVSKNKALEYLYCFGNQLTELNVGNNKALEMLDCHGNKLEKLTFRSNESLKRLTCHDNQLTSLDVSPNQALKTLYCFNNMISELDLSKNSELESIDCMGNALTLLDLSKNSHLKRVDCSDNRIVELNLQGASMLETLRCDNNPLSSLDLAGAQELISISCEGNQITGLNLSGNTKLVHVYPKEIAPDDLKLIDDLLEPEDTWPATWE